MKYGPLLGLIKETLKKFKNVYPLYIITEVLLMNRNIPDPQKNIYRRWVNDIYMLIEILILSLLIYQDDKSYIICCLVWFMIISKFIFYVNEYVINPVRNRGSDDYRARQARKIFVVIISIFINVLYFSILYRCHFDDCVVIKKDATCTDYILLSFNSILSFGYDSISPIGCCGYYLILVQKVITYAYVVFMLNRYLSFNE